MSEGLDMGKVVGMYVRLRDKKAEIEASVKEQVSVINDQLDKLEQWIKQQADAQGVTSFKTAKGTAFITTTDYASVADWDAFLDWVRKNEAYDALTKGANKTAVRGYIDSDKVVPPGINYGTKLNVNVRRPSAT